MKHSDFLLDFDCKSVMLVVFLIFILIMDESGHLICNLIAACYFFPTFLEPVYFELDTPVFVDLNFCGIVGCNFNGFHSDYDLRTKAYYEGSLGLEVLYRNYPRMYIYAS